MESTAALRGNWDTVKEEKPSKTITGNFERRTTAQNAPLKVDPASFKQSPSENIQKGMRVLHMKFGEGKVLAIDGSKDNRIATILFQDIDSPERRIMLKFAKLQIVE
jgi:DNA helicase-2/ATP-dependent DNA helicase PcrA